MKSMLLILTFLISLFVQAQVEIKEFHKSIVPVSEDLYASRFEVSNELYVRFTDDLKANGRISEWKEARIDSTQWSKAIKANEPYVVYYHAHEAYRSYPVVNVSYPGAELFCEWLTEQYNQHPKKKFEKVTVRIPTEQEWAMAARAGLEEAVYPWSGDEIYTSKGAVKANFFKEGGDESLAGALNSNADITAPVQSYSPNKLGLYNMAGNVAEMVQGGQVVKGGSWLDEPDQLRIDQNTSYNGEPSPQVGFRFFVEVIEK